MTLALSVDQPPMAKWHVLCLFLVFRYKLFLVVIRDTAPEGTKIPKETENDGKLPAGMRISGYQVTM